MHRIVVIRILGVLLTLYSLTMIPPLVIGWWEGDGSWQPFAESLVILFVIGAVTWYLSRGHGDELRMRDGFLVVAGAWTLVGLASALPLLLAQQPELGVSDAVFEAISGLTTTGSTVITGLDQLPRSVLFYRQQLCWLGGMGIIVLAVAVLPMLRIGGMQLYRAETPGAMKDSKLTPRIKETAKALWYVYLTFTVLCAASYWIAGMTLFDAISHSFSTVATAGFSTHDASFAYFDSAMIEGVAVVFMILGGMSYALHFLAWRELHSGVYSGDPETRAYLSIMIFGAVLAVCFLLLHGPYDDLGNATRYGVFQVVSFMTTTGFTSTPFYLWSGLVPALLLLLGNIGGCGGSTSGGVKSLRVLLLYRLSLREIKRLIHPSAHLAVKLRGTKLTGRLMDAVWGFFFLYAASYLVMSFILLAIGLDMVTAFGSVATAIGNIGPGLGETGANFASINDTAKWVLSFAMILGRLEVFTVLVLFSPAFWRN